ncbi:Gfo/Idh/MocA family protein [Nocardia tengchongensis]|uniref:Gfo/Idh/MocA family protein n=1 Tax=Nocardia tengchongensis TaxID=2055889 RepID=UPI00361398BC
MRIGILGAATIAPTALIGPAAAVPEVEVTAIAARDRTRAEAFARKHGIAQVHDSYADLLTAVDAVYIPLPNSLHARWTLQALAAGRHVLCEKPLTANAAEAVQVADEARRTGLTVMEAFHYRYHPLAERMREIAATELGEIRRVESSMCFPLPKFGDIRYRLDLAGGATMDAGCYAIHSMRLFDPGRPVVTGARALLRSPGVDRAMTADFRFPSGAEGRITASMWSRSLLRIGLRVEGERGTMKVFNHVLPQAFHRLTVTVDGVTRRERIPGEATYVRQLRAFASAVAGADTNLTPPSDSVINMELIDEVYRAAGLEPRGSVS